MSLSDSKSPYVSRTLLSNRADLNSLDDLHTYSDFQLVSPFTKRLGTVQVRQLQLVSPSPTCSTAFLVLWQGSSTCLSFRFSSIFFSVIYMASSIIIDI